MFAFLLCLISLTREVLALLKSNANGRGNTMVEPRSDDTLVELRNDAVNEKTVTEDEDEALVDGDSASSTERNNGKRSRKISDVIDSVRDYEFTQPGHSTPRQRKPMQLDLVIMIIGVMGCCRRDEITQIRVQDIKEEGSLIVINIPKTTTQLHRRFTVDDTLSKIIKKYRKLRPKNVATDRFFLNYHHERCTMQVIGKNKIAGIPNRIAKWLKLDNPHLYTGRALRKISATLSSNPIGSMMDLRHLGSLDGAGWESDQVAEDYVEHSIKKEINIPESVDASNNLQSDMSEKSERECSSPLLMKVKVESISIDDEEEGNSEQEYSLPPFMEVNIESNMIENFDEENFEGENFEGTCSSSSLKRIKLCDGNISASDNVYKVSPDQGYGDTPEQDTKLIPEWMHRRSDHIDATPPGIVDTEYQVHNGTPSGITAFMPVSKEAERYNMSHPSRGKCLVFNHEIFETGFSNREGSTVDAKRIETTFTKLGFDVVVHNNLEHSDVLDEIKKLSGADHTNNDCVCVFVLTHGLNNDLLMAKDAAYRSDKIWKPFTADNCPTLAGKPKLFFYQACRGDKLDGGITLMSRSGNTQTDSAIASYKIPTHSDFLIAHSSVEGFFSWRNPEEGTWYIQCLCSVIDQFSATTDLLKMLTITARRVATEFQSYDDTNQQKNEQKQVPSATSMLIRDLYFTSK